jgi:DNA modification methylase
MPKPHALTAHKKDCVPALAGLAGTVKLLVADPPYNFGQPYDAYSDNKSYSDYMEWTRKWLGAATAALHPHGSLWVFCPDEWVSEIDLLARKAFKLTKRRQVQWIFTFGQAAQKNFTRSHCHLLYFSKAKTKFTFNESKVRVPSARQLVYGDARANKKGKLPDDTWVLLREQLESAVPRDADVWLQSRVCGTFKERRKHSPNQIPVPVMERIVLACSNKGDLVADPFCGTGSLGEACALHGRNYIGYDVSGDAVKATRERITNAMRGPVRRVR